MLKWSTPDARRPQPTQSKSTGFIWPPRLVDIQKQKTDAVGSRDAAPSAAQQIRRRNSGLQDISSVTLPGENSCPSPTDDSSGGDSPIKGSETTGLERQDSVTSTLTIAEQEPASEDLPVATMEPPRQPSLSEPSASEDPSIVATEVHRQSSPTGPIAIRESEPRAVSPLELRSPPSDPEKSQVPKIKVQAPSQGSDTMDDHSKTAREPRRIESVLANESQVSSEQTPVSKDSNATKAPQPNEDQGGASEISPTHRPRKRTMMLRKTRNFVARKAFLKTALGSRFAIPAKEGLQRLARGEDIDLKIVEKPQTNQITAGFRESDKPKLSREPNEPDILPFSITRE